MYSWDMVGRRPVVQDIDGIGDEVRQGYEKGSLFLLWITSRGLRQANLTCWCFTLVVQEVNLYAIRIQKILPANTSMIPRGSKYGYRFLNNVYESIYTTLLISVMTKTEILHIRWNVLTLATCTTCSPSFVRTANTLPLTTSVALVDISLPFYTLAAINTDTSNELYGHVFLWAGNFPLQTFRKSMFQAG